ncbi:MAG: hypothetical protein ABSA26_05400 [Thermoguttaceae bacterium]|jgi:hypothetical protein
MKTLHSTVKSGGWLFLTAWLLFLPAIAYAAEAAKQQPARDPSACELKIEGRRVEKLTLADEQGKLMEIDHPGPSVFLAPGRYQIKEIRVQWDEGGRVYTDTDVNYLTLGPSGTYQLNIGTPETPEVTVTRRGKLLSLSYNVREVYPNMPRSSPPQIGFYQGDEKIASGAFAYG